VYCLLDQVCESQFCVTFYDVVLGVAWFSGYFKIKHICSLLSIAPILYCLSEESLLEVYLVLSKTSVLVHISLNQLFR
jgi:hypothetical protein